MEEKPTVLFVDDDPDLLIIWEREFTERGFTVKSACNGHEAVKIVRYSQIDIIVTDLKMPQVDGNLEIEVLLEYFKNPPPIIVVSAYLPASEAENKIGNIYKALAKPVDITQLESVIREALQHESNN